jgi:hypothetical protein
VFFTRGDRLLQTTARTCSATPGLRPVTPVTAGRRRPRRRLRRTLASAACPS